jgi:hypothetical protein
MNRAELKALRTAFADYRRSEGCSCCRDIEGHKENEARIAKILNVPKYPDGNGFNFAKFRTPDRK